MLKIIHLHVTHTYTCVYAPVLIPLHTSHEAEKPEFAPTRKCSVKNIYISQIQLNKFQGKVVNIEEGTLTLTDLGGSLHPTLYT